jgi:hypothetical protein
MAGEPKSSALAAFGRTLAKAGGKEAAGASLDAYHRRPRVADLVRTIAQSARLCGW